MFLPKRRLTNAVKICNFRAANVNLSEVKSLRNPFPKFLAIVISISVMPTLALASSPHVLKIVPKKLILSIGLGKFEDPLWHQLRFAGKDARDVYNAFTSGEGAFDGGDLLVADSALATLPKGAEPQNESISLADIEKSMSRLSRNNRSEDDTVVVYLSTHGTVAYKEDGSVGRYIITSKSNSKNLKETSLDYDRLMSWFNGLKSRKKVLILAFCHSGVGKSALTPDMKKALAMLKSPYFEEPMQQRSEGTIILTASGWREPAIEDPKLENDVYTYFLLKGLSRDQNADGAVSITEAHQFASQMTYQYTKGRQRPSAILELLGSDPIIVSGKPKAVSKATLYSLVGRYSNFLVSVDGSPQGSLSKGLTLPEGKVRLTLRDPVNQSIVADKVMHVEAGREYSVSDLLTPSLPNSLTFGAEQIFFLNDKVRREYVPSDLIGLRLSYKHEDWWSIYDLDLSVSFFDRKKETITTADDMMFLQSRRMLSADLKLGTRTVVRSLTRSDGGIVTEFRSLLGVSALMVNREVESAAFDQNSLTLVTPGVKLVGAYDFLVPYYLLRFSVESHVGMYKNFTSEGPLFLPTLGLHASMGMFW